MLRSRVKKTALAIVGGLVVVRSPSPFQMVSPARFAGQTPSVAAEATQDRFSDAVGNLIRSRIGSRTVLPKWQTYCLSQTAV